MGHKKVSIGMREIGDGNECFIAAEAGTTCNGDISLAKDLVDAAALGGFDAIKFQTIWPEQVSDKSTIFRYETVDGWVEEDMYEMFKSLVFSIEEWMEIASYTRSKGLIFFSTVDFPDGVDILEACDVPIHKMGSWDVTYEPLIIKIANTKKPVMLDLGPATLGEIVRFVELIENHGSGEVVLLHDFHTTDRREMNMLNIPYLKKLFNIPVGFSAPGRDHDLDIMAVSLGANMIEKRITLNRKSKGHHHALSLEPQEFKPWVERIRCAEKALGRDEIRPSAADLEDARKYYRSLCTTRSVKKGEVFSTKSLDGKRPGTGIPTRYQEIVLGRKAAGDLDKDTILTWEDIQ